MGSANLSPEEFVQGGGLIDDANVEFKECRFEMFDYNGTVIPGVPSLRITMETEEGEEVSQNYSMGNASEWKPSDDGKELLAIGKSTAIRTTSNGGIFLQNLVDAGYPAENLGVDISVLDGLKAHVIQIPAPKRSGLKRTTEKKYEDTILVVDEILEMPGEKKSKSKTKSKAKGKSTKAKGKASKPTDDVSAQTEEAVMEVLLNSGGSIPRKKLPGEVFQVAKALPDRNEIVKMSFDEEFLSVEGHAWVYDPDTETLTMG